MNTLRLSALLVPVALAPAALRAQDYGAAQGNVPTTIAARGEKVQAVLTKHPVTARTLSLCDGPAADEEGNLFFSEPSTHHIYKVTPAGVGSVFFAGTDEAPQGMEFDPQGRLLVAAKGAILRFSKAGVKEVFATSPDFKDLQDITVGSNGSMYVTNYRGKTFFQVSADGKVIKPYAGLVSPTGIEWIEEKNTLYVSDLDPHTTWQYVVAGDGTVATKTSYVPDIPGAYGITMDSKAQVYIAGYVQGSVHLYSTPRKDPFLGHILVKGSPTPSGNNTNQAFGGTDHKTLYITGNGGAFKIPLVVAGRKRPIAPIGIRPLTKSPLRLLSESNRDALRDVRGKKAYPTGSSILFDFGNHLPIPIQNQP